MLKGLLQTDLYYCNHLGVSENDAKDIMDFTSRDAKGAGLISYIQHNAFPDEENGVMRSYIVRDIQTSEIVGYFSLKAGLVSFNEHEVPIIDEIEKESRKRLVFDTLPGVELANFAVNHSFIHKHPDLKGLGFVIYQRFILPIIKEASKTLGIKILYLFALPYDELIERYKKYGFTRLNDTFETQIHNRLKPRYDEFCIFMYRML